MQDAPSLPFAPSALAVELSRELMSAEAARAIAEQRNELRKVIKDVHEAISKNVEARTISLYISRDYSRTIVEALRIQGYETELSVIATPFAYGLKIDW